MKTDKLVRFLLRCEIGSTCLIDFICNDPDLSTCSDLYDSLSREIRKHYENKSGVEGPSDSGASVTLIQDMERLYIRIIQSNELVPAQVKFDVCKSLVDFRCLNSTRNPPPEATTDKLNILARKYLDSVDINSTGTTKATLEAKREFKDFFDTVDFGWYYPLFRCDSIFKAVREFKSACSNVGYISLYVYLNFLLLSTSTNWNGDLCLKLIDAIHTNPFDILEEK